MSLYPNRVPIRSMIQILEANEPAPDRDQEFIFQHGKVSSPKQLPPISRVCGVEMHLACSKVQLTLLNLSNARFHISKVSAKATHNDKRLGDVDLSGDWNWTFELGLQKPPLVPVKWSMLSFGSNPIKGISMVFDGSRRRGALSVDVVGEADVSLGELDVDTMEVRVNGGATKSVCREGS